MNRPALLHARALRTAGLLVLAILSGCQKATIYATTPLVGTSCWRIEVGQGPAMEYEYTLRLQNKDGSLIWSATSPEPLQFRVLRDKPFTQISWRASQARVKSFRPFEISLFLQSAGPNPIPVSVPTHPKSPFEAFAFGAIPIHL